MQQRLAEGLPSEANCVRVVRQGIFVTEFNGFMPGGSLTIRAKIQQRRLFPFRLQDGNLAKHMVLVSEFHGTN